MDKYTKDDQYYIDSTIVIQFFNLKNLKAMSW
jgi:hypothetical protein